MKKITPYRLKKFNSLVVFCCIILSMQAHHEPSKTLFEKKEKEKAQINWKSSHVKLLTSFKFSVNDQNQPINGKNIYVQKLGRDGNYKSFVEKQIFKSDLTLDCTFNYEYDDNGFLVKIVKTKADSPTDWDKLYLYDINGNVSKINRYDSAGKLSYIIRLNYEYYN